MRNRIKAAIRRWFERQGYVEVEPGCLQISPGNETHLHAFATEWRDDAGGRRPLYLHTSPEFAMKKLLSAGEEKIFAFTPAFRNRECDSALHAPEFTMPEWYQTGVDYRVTMEQCAAIVAIAARVAARRTWSFKDRVAQPCAAPDFVTVADAFATSAGVDLLATIAARGSTDRDALAAQAKGAGVRVSDADNWSDLFSRILVERVEPRLGAPRPTVLYEYPAPEAALARVCAHDPRVAERFEIYVCGVELANGFGELTDAVEQRRRFEAAMADKARLYGERYPLDEDFLAALAHMPAASGAALGFDRLAMLAVGAPRLADVIWTPLS
jgi:lysyl-tRNA synthetase class 2